MYYTEKIQLHQAAELFAKCGLSIPEGVDLTIGVFDDADGSLAATGSLKGDMLQGMAVDPARQGEDLTARVLTALIGEARDAQSLYLFTKPEKALQFTGLGFRLVAKARPYAALLEWGRDSVRQYRAQLESVRAAAGLDDNAVAGALVMNCNPFTKGHRYLIETAARACDHVFVLVVEEDLSRFSFRDRLELVKRGTADLQNVTVIGGGRYAVSDLTFPSYFTKEEKVADAHAAMDTELFATVIAPALGISRRFVGTEPHSAVTKVYNETLEKRLPKYGIGVIEVPRLETDGTAISASRVRELLDLGDEAAWEEIQRLVPATTYAYLWENARPVTLMELLDARENRVMHQRKLLETYGGVLVSMTLNIPGPVKDKEIYRKALEYGMEKLEAAFAPEVVLHREIRHLKTGSEGYLVIDEAGMDMRSVKETAISIEDQDDLGRIFDIDVMSEKGGISRTDLGHPGRKCLLCGADAKVCARAQRHPMTDLMKKIENILEKCPRI
ncbi:MAG: [Firmicutes bacterium]|nr:[citrate (pro-3S)-lyase] ligase [Bacillota bacterium]